MSLVGTTNQFRDPVFFKSDRRCDWVQRPVIFGPGKGNGGIYSLGEACLSLAWNRKSFVIRQKHI